METPGGARATLFAAAAALLALAAPSAPLAAAPGPAAPDTSGGGLVVGAGRWGLGFGDVPVLHGIRIDLGDRALRRADGVDLVLWAPARDAGGTVNGLAIGPVGPGPDRIRGVGAGLLGAVAQQRADGLLAGGLG
ncbi:MAG TPA: hypothetical protein VKA44_08400, partial [Gemmatimonadota bacterium]|nr:hypothetical protein [Gemmatimonadota bacterium]